MKGIVVNCEERKILRKTQSSIGIEFESRSGVTLEDSRASPALTQFLNQI